MWFYTLAVNAVSVSTLALDKSSSCKRSYTRQHIAMLHSMSSLYQPVEDEEDGFSDASLLCYYYCHSTARGSRYYNVRSPLTFELVLQASIFAQANVTCTGRGEL